MPSIETDGREQLFYKDWGTGEPIVFIHGFAVNADIWEYQMATLADHGRRCIAYDRRATAPTASPVPFSSPRSRPSS